MKYVSFLAANGTETWGVAIDGTVYDLGPTGKNLAANVRELIENGAFGTELDLSGAPTIDEAEITHLPSLTNPGKIICIGVNYLAHQEESGKTGQTAPTVFTRFADTQMGHLAPAVKPASTTKFDYEGEMALVIGKEAWRVSEEDSWDHIAGYACYNDFSVRDWQKAASQWIPGKNFPATGGFGPYLVPAKDLGDVNKLTLETRVNGEVRQNAPVSNLVFNIPQLINYVTAFTKLNPGDVVVTGTPGGVGLFWGEGGLLNDGDVVEVEITGLGVLRNTVKDEV
ncbi:fumarylacetoacetate hydrolase family protein [Glutamicibacter ardleyensis]|uniref:5-carboxymethyl-2-hydroxymuconate isomerase n=1 Tax=Glutamicibacter ardleyensis TaxID=225894 RepID=A0ABQ2DE01_9MICC|nr:fumarylacetoacetate hydrolase family protein [Glutamicibacter ardleyensis]GGJ51156.1 5-carboxymethyl-2-hydroxymuconate isomerase [Glutamicibacter ardleyensis]